MQISVIAKRPAASALASLEARVHLVDDVNAALAANQTVVAVACLERFKRILDLHYSDPRVMRANDAAHSNKNAPPRDALIGWTACSRLGIFCQLHGRFFPVDPGLKQLFPGADPGDMAHLATGPRFRFAVEMQNGIGFGRDFGDSADIVANQVFHNAIGMPLGIAQREAGNGANMLFKLGDCAGGFRPVARIVHPGGDLIDEQAMALTIANSKKLDSKNTDIIQMTGDC